MSVSLDGFNAEAPENQPQADVVPKGEYVAVLVASERLETNDKTGAYLNCQWQIAEGEYQNRVVFEKLNLWLDDSTDGRRKAVLIAKGQLSKICRAVGILTPKSTDELLGRPILIKVGIEEKDDGYGPKNKIVDYKPRDGAASTNGSRGMPPVSSNGGSSASSRQPAMAAAASGGAKKNPW